MQVKYSFQMDNTENITFKALSLVTIHSVCYVVRFEHHCTQKMLTNEKKRFVVDEDLRHSYTEFMEENENWVTWSWLPLHRLTHRLRSMLLAGDASDTLRHVRRRRYYRVRQP